MTNSSINNNGNSPKVPKRRSAFEEHIGDHRKVFLFNFCAERGSKTDIDFMEGLVDSDPKKFILCSTDPRHLVNSKNSKGQSPLYLAAKNGNLLVVKYLERKNVNYSVSAFRISRFKLETPLEAACRWNHVEVVKFIVQKFEINDKELSKCLLTTRNQEIRNSLMENGARIKLPLLSRFFCK